MLAQRSFMSNSEIKSQAQKSLSPVAVKEEVRTTSPYREMSPQKPDGINFTATQNLGVTWNRLEERDDLVSTFNHQTSKMTTQLQNLAATPTRERTSLVPKPSAIHDQPLNVQF